MVIPPGGVARSDDRLGITEAGNDHPHDRPIQRSQELTPSTKAVEGHDTITQIVSQGILWQEKAAVDHGIAVS